MTVSTIPPSFLRDPPPNATIRQLDFTQTTPPIPTYKNHVAAIIDNFMTPTECTELLRLAGESCHPSEPASTSTEPTWQRALVNAGTGAETLSSSRKSGRYIWDTPEVASRLLARLRPFLSSLGLDRIENQPVITGLAPARRGEVLVLAGLNERLRFLRYQGGDYFRPHCDARYTTPDRTEMSLLTVHLYLNGEGEQDWAVLGPEVERVAKGLYQFGKEEEEEREEGEDRKSDAGKTMHGDGNSVSDEPEALLGGATSFGADYRMRDPVRVFPKTGSLLIFQQRNLMHSGDDVFRGVKYTVRTDVMYRFDAQEK